MKKVFMTILLLVVLIVSSPVSKTQDKGLHPRNKMLIEQGLIPPMKYFPEVPRITAKEALALYTQGQSMFIGIGTDVPRLPLGWLLIDYYNFDPTRLKIPRNKIIVVYCG